MSDWHESDQILKQDYEKLGLRADTVNKTRTNIIGRAVIAHTFIFSHMLDLAKKSSGLESKAAFY